MIMDTLFASLASQLRDAHTLLAVAATTIGALERCGYIGIAVIAHDADGTPAVWAGSHDLAGGDARAWLERDHASDPVLAEVRRTHATASSETGVWIAPLLGCGTLIGTLRVHAREAGDHRAQLSLAAWLVSVRLALLGLEAPLAAHVRTALTARQHEVAYLVARGCTNPEIGRMLAISANAVKKHVSRVLEVVGASNRTELAALTGRWSAAGPAPTGLVVVEAAKSAWSKGGSGSSRAA